MTRRDFFALAGTAGALSSLGPSWLAAAGQEALLRARPTPPTTSHPRGQHKLGLGDDRDGLLYVPRGYKSDVAAPLVVMLHGASNRAQAVDYTFPLADEFGVIILAPDSRGRGTWDALEREFEADVQFIDGALAHTFRRYSVDPQRLAMAGFSDGASYALALGIANGGLFGRVMAFSPGTIPPVARRGKPRIFVSHGTRDTVLRIDSTSRRIVPRLKAQGYDVTYREFDGPHTVPVPIAREALEWFRT